MNCLHTFLRVLCVVDGRSAAEIRAVLGISPATLKRHLVEARTLGCRIEFDRWDGKYRLKDAGPFDVRRLRMAVSRRRGKQQQVVLRVAA